MQSGWALSVSQVLQILHQEQAIKRHETWARRSHSMDLQTKRIDMINTVREEMRDQVRLMVMSVESLMFTAALLSSVGFGFVCEGTFPRSERDGGEYTGEQQWALEANSVFAALALVFPLGALVLASAIRMEAELCFKDVQCDLNAHIRRALGRVYRLQSPALPAAVEVDDVEPSDELASFLEDAGLVAALAQGLVQRVCYFHRLFPVAQLFFFCGLLSAVLNCCAVQGVIFVNRFPSAPSVWRAYSGIVAGTAIGCTAFVAWVHRRLRREAPDLEPAAGIACAAPCSSASGGGSQTAPEGAGGRGGRPRVRCRGPDAFACAGGTLDEPLLGRGWPRSPAAAHTWHSG